MSVPAVLIRISTGEIIKHDIYPQTVIEPISTLDPDLKWLIKYTPYNVPDYDSRVFSLITTQEITEAAHPTYPLMDQYLITYDTQKRSDAEITIQIENAETDANEGLLPYQQRVKLLTLGLGVLIRKTDGLTLTNKEIAIQDKIVTAAVKIWKNDNELKLKLQQLVDGIEPEIDGGWENS